MMKMSLAQETMGVILPIGGVVATPYTRRRYRSVALSGDNRNDVSQLVKELRLAGIATIAEVNRFLDEWYLPINKKGPPNTDAARSGGHFYCVLTRSMCFLDKVKKNLHDTNIHTIFMY
jgi:hypothetical protein